MKIYHRVFVNKFFLFFRKLNPNENNDSSIINSNKNNSSFDYDSSNIQNKSNIATLENLLTNDDCQFTNDSKYKYYYYT